MTRMSRRSLVLAVLCGASALSHAATPVECLQFSVRPDGDAQFQNGCSDALNLLYCVDSDASARPCAVLSSLVVTLHYGVSETLAGYVNAGKPAVHSAVCFYPQAPIDWKPGAAGSWGCKKTCVMC